MNKFIISISLAAFSLAVSAQDVKDQLNPVYYGVNSLAIAPDARAGGMGDVGVATDPDVNSQYWNPAKYPFTISRSGVSVNYTPWLRQITSDIDLANVSGYYRIGNYDAISGSLRYFSLGEVIVNYNEEDIIKPYEMAIDVAYSRMLSETFSAGVALRYIYSDLGFRQDDETTPGSAFAADIAMYHNGYLNLGNRECQLGWGVNVSNIGSKISFDDGNTSEFIPTNLRIGASLLMPIDEYNTFAISADANKLLVPTRPTMAQYLEETGSTDEQNFSGYVSWLMDQGYYNISPISGIFKSFHDAPGGGKEELQEVQWSLGLEYAYDNKFFLRAGYHYEHPNKGNRKYYTLGAGFKMNIFSVDAGYIISAAQSNPLDQTLRISLSFDMDGIGDILGKKRR
ncbi:MAG: type IX secretion system outer membrane channel protein PorV [Bacteroidaceae bacterium]|jgi:opacity protein-like surface antigen|nr:type IX secretion system outer membrane channel protein PorV [Bacteroidaceae bacterium]MBQ9176655.1 type IX secretion system outer membrane channel protein PorV [Bacteroidaceae bacterium]